MLNTSNLRAFKVAPGDANDPEDHSMYLTILLRVRGYCNEILTTMLSAPASRATHGTCRTVLRCGS
jgi:hypothetical protein